MLDEPAVVGAISTFQTIFILLVYLVLDLNPWQSLNVSDGDFRKAPRSTTGAGYSDFGINTGSTK
jgi:hypothetical protein